MESDWKERIDVVPQGGRPTVRASGVPVEAVLHALASGATPESLSRDLPGLTHEDIRACIAFAAESVRRDYILEKVKRGLADVKAGRVIPDEDLDAFLARERPDE